MAKTIYTDLCYVHNLMTLRKKGLQCSKFIIFRGLSSKNGEFQKYSSRSVLGNGSVSKRDLQTSSFKQIEGKIACRLNLLNLISRKKTPSSVKNFSTSKRVWLFMKPSNQNKEKVDNIITFAITVTLILFTVYMNLIMRHHEDYVQIDSDESQDK